MLTGGQGSSPTEDRSTPEDTLSGSPQGADLPSGTTTCPLGTATCQRQIAMGGESQDRKQRPQRCGVEGAVSSHRRRTRLHFAPEDLAEAGAGTRRGAPVPSGCNGPGRATTPRAVDAEGGPLLEGGDQPLLRLSARRVTLV